MNIIKWFFVAMLVAGISACGGGGGSSGSSGGGGNTSTYKISGTVTGGTVSGVTITVAQNGMTAVTNANGAYVLSGLSAGSYTITPSDGTIQFTPASRAVTISNSDITGVNFTDPVSTYKISGTVTGGTVSGVTITVAQNGMSAVTNANGAYSLSGLSAGSYTITPSDGTIQFTPASRAVTISNSDITGVNFTDPYLYQISGTVTGGTPSGVTITVSPNGSSVATAADGTYILPNIPAGVYTVTPTDGTIQFTPASRTVTVSNGDITGVDFTDPLLPLSVGKIVYPCLNAICEINLATGAETTILTLTAPQQPQILAPFRASNRLMYEGVNMTGGYIISLISPSPIEVILGGVNLTNVCTGPDGDSFDVVHTANYGDLMFTAALCFVGNADTGNIFVVKLNTYGTEENVQVTNNDGSSYSFSPVFAGINANGYLRVLFVKGVFSGSSTTDSVWEQLVDMATGTLIGSPIELAANVTDAQNDRDLAVNASYTKFVFTRIVSNVTHVLVKTIADGLGGAETDLGPGGAPYWSNTTNLNSLIMFTIGHTGAWTLVAEKPDGTGEVSVPTPSDLVGGTEGVVFAPPSGT